MLFVLNAHGRPFRPETFGKWFSKQCLDAGASRLANAGAGEFEVMAFLGDYTPNEARTYGKQASRAKPDA
ncbi:MAG: hypothetical protein AAF724_05705 [Pseudomonadota bacterium]